MQILPLSFLFFFYPPRQNARGRGGCSELGTQDTGTPEVGLLLNQTNTHPTSMVSKGLRSFPVGPPLPSLVLKATEPGFFPIT